MLRGLRILIADDKPEQLDAFVKDLESLRATVAVANRSDNGYWKAIQTIPDLVVSDLASPGEHGWEFVRRIRRHPLLRWTPILLFKWWDETEDGKREHALVRTLDRMKEVLAPQRFLANRIAQRGPRMTDQLENTGPITLVRLLAQAKLTGLLNVNDTWSNFEICLENGDLGHAQRTGIDGQIDTGEIALVQFMLCEAGKWSFQEAPPSDKTGSGRKMDQAISESGQFITSLFDPQLDSNLWAPDRIQIRLDVFGAVMSTLSTMDQQIAGMLLSAANGHELGEFIENENALNKTASALQNLIRCGAILPVKTPIEDSRQMEEERTAKCVSFLFESMSGKRVDISTLIKTTPRQPKETDSPQQGMKATATLGMYSISGVRPEKVASKIRETIKMPGTLTDRGERAIYDTPFNEAEEKPRPKPPMIMANSNFISGIVHDSLAPSPRNQDKEEADNKHKWFAIILAVALTGILIATLAYIGAGVK